MRRLRTCRILVFSLLCLAASGWQGGVMAQVATPEASPVAGGGASTAVAWLLSQQAEDGSFTGFSGEADAGTTVDALFALAAAQQIGIDTSAAIDSGVNYLSSGDVALVYTQTGVGQAAKFALLLSTLGLDPHNLANVDPLSIVGFGQDAGTGLYGSGVFDHALSMLALISAGEPVPAEMVTALQPLQAENGGWAWDGSTADADVDTNTTSLVIQALAASGQPDNGMLQAGLDFLKTTLHEGAGAAYNADPASLPDANSTALVIQAAIASGGNPESAEWQDLVSSLLTFQNADGSFGYQEGAMDPNLAATIQAIPALANVALPFSPVTGEPVGIVPAAWLQAA